VASAQLNRRHRGTYRSVRELNAKIRAYIDGWNDRCQPFTWTKTADHILTKTNRRKTSRAEHEVPFLSSADHQRTW
jgi:hypothetical protein